VKNTPQHRNWISSMHLAGRAALLFAAVLVSAVITTQSAQAQTFNILDSFNGTDGYNPVGGLVQTTHGDLYGTTNLGGANSVGTVFKITPSGTLTTVYNFCSQSGCTDGAEPSAGLIQATNGDLYGTTQSGGVEDDGTVFKITPSGTLTTLYKFCETSGCPDGYSPEAGLLQASNGNFYGTTYLGGAHADGTIFKMTAAGALTTLHTFDGTDGAYPARGVGLMQASNGSLYGLTEYYGTNGGGTVFEMTTGGTLTTLYSFCKVVNGLGYCTDGERPEGGLVQATDGNFYGVTETGGANDSGTVFKITPTGTLTTLYSFCSVVVNSTCTDGASPTGGLIQATDGNLYGITDGGGANTGGTVFEITLGGTLTTLYSFGSNGSNPGYAGLVQDTGGAFYGTTGYGGSFLSVCPSGCGTIFDLSAGLGPFVALQTTSGKEGAKIGILGQGFSSSSVVKFGGTQATTIALTGTTFISATVPAGALTGSVTVTTGATTLTSSHTFRVTPTLTSFSPPSGPVGTPVTITGTGLTQATNVRFNGKSASFTATSDTQISTTVPTGATSGKIAVTTPGGSATSTTSFTVN